MTKGGKGVRGEGPPLSPPFCLFYLLYFFTSDDGVAGLVDSVDDFIPDFVSPSALAIGALCFFLLWCAAFLAGWSPVGVSAEGAVAAGVAGAAILDS